jgi:hypothetical protein
LNLFLFDLDADILISAYWTGFANSISAIIPFSCHAKRREELLMTTEESGFEEYGW